MADSKISVVDDGYDDMIRGFHDYLDAGSYAAIIGTSPTTFETVALSGRQSGDSEISENTDLDCENQVHVPGHNEHVLAMFEQNKGQEFPSTSQLPEVDQSHDATNWAVEPGSQGDHIALPKNKRESRANTKKSRRGQPLRKGQPKPRAWTQDETDTLMRMMDAGKSREEIYHALKGSKPLGAIRPKY